jgi:hypothetical protein
LCAPCKQLAEKVWQVSGFDDLSVPYYGGNTYRYEGELYPAITKRDAVLYAAIKVDISKIEYNGNADTVLWERLLELYTKSQMKNGRF